MTTPIITKNSVVKKELSDVMKILLGLYEKGKGEVATLQGEVSKQNEEMTNEHDKFEREIGTLESECIEERTRIDKLNDDIRCLIVEIDELKTNFSMFDFNEIDNSLHPRELINGQYRIMSCLECIANEMSKRSVGKTSSEWMLEGCSICLQHDAIPNSVLPCGHCFCGGCVSRLKECAKCKKAFTEVTQLYDIVRK